MWNVPVLPSDAGSDPLPEHGLPIAGKWWHTPLTPVLQRPRQVDLSKLEAAWSIK